MLGRQVVDNLYEIAQTGSDAAALMAGLPADRSWTAISVPLDPTGIGQVAYGLQPGDYVDVIMSFLFVDVDEEFQTRLPNTISVITRAETGELVIGAPRSGRTEPSTLSPEGVLVGPSETAQRPRLVTQRTVTDAWVLHVGYFPPGGNIVGATPTPIAVEAPPPAPGDPNAQQAPPTAVPTATPYAPTIITLAVRRRIRGPGVGDRLADPDHAGAARPGGRSRNRSGVVAHDQNDITQPGLPFAEPRSAASPV